MSEIFNVLIINENLEIDYRNEFSLIPQNNKRLNIITASNIKDAEEIILKTTINLILISEPKIFPHNYNNPVSEGKLTLRTSRKIININFSDILFIESDRHRCIINKTDNTTISVSISIGNILEKLNNSNLVRCHRSYIVNTEKISSIDKSSEPWLIHFNNSNKLAFVSRSYRNSISRIFNNM